MSRAAGACMIVLAALLLPGVARATAQDPRPPADEEARGSTVEEIRVLGAPGREGEIVAALRVRPGQPLDNRALRESIEWLWKYKRIRVDRVSVEPGSTEEAVVVVLEVTVKRAWRRTVFVGNEAFERSELELWAGLVGQAVDVDAVQQVILRLEERYREEGYAHVVIDWESREGLDEIRFLIDEGPKVTVEDVEFVGNDAIRGGAWWTPGLDVYGALNNRPGWLFFRGSPYSEERIREDVNAVRQLFRDYGFRDVEVSAETEFYGSKRDKARVRYVIEQGPLYRVRSVTVRAPDGESLRFEEEVLKEKLKVRPGTPFERARVDASMAALRRFYGELGYPSLVRVRDEPASRRGDYFRLEQDPVKPGGGPRLVFDREQALVDVVFVVHEGEPKRIRDVLVRGATRTEDRVVRREIENMPGELALEEDARTSARRLSATGYFRDENRVPYVNWYWRDVGREDWVDLVFEVKDEGSNNRLRFGGAWNSENGPALIIDLQKTNFDIADPPSSFRSSFREIWNGDAFTGAGQTLGVSLRPGTEFSTYSLNFLEPDLLREHVDRLSLSVYARRRIRFFSTYDEDRDAFGFTLGRRFGRNFTLFAGPEYQAVDVEDIDSGAPQDLLDQAGKNSFGSLTMGARWNTVEDPFSPVGGEDVTLRLTDTGHVFGSDWEFFESELTAEKFFPLWTDGKDRPWVLALRGRLRKAWPQGDLTTLPYTEKYYLGGQSTVRGFQYRGIGEDALGFARGGDAAWDASMEVRFPLVSTRQRGLVEEFELVRGGLFVDAGSFGPDLDDFGPTRVSAGFGVRMRFPALPAAPISLDFGWPIESEPGDGERVFSFTLGNF